VDDDASIRRFVEMALEGLGIDLLLCAGVTEALTELHEHGPVELLMTDLMMPRENGLALLKRLSDEPALRGRARIVVFSAGLRGPMQSELEGHDVWRQLSKPVSAMELEACVRDGVAAASASVRPLLDGPILQGPERGDPEGLDDNALVAITTNFRGDRDLYLAFRDGCVAQFASDMSRGDASLANLDLSDLRHLAHSLKSVLALLGHGASARIARQLEDCTARHEATQTSILWHQLRSNLVELIALARS
jgi:CheY-like chemotaxis protein